ncbi:neural cell adhesion molecule 2-like [Syngnathus typhle]|uniref:neural cell adhesion molecule 2-like n=1 Tax=Syngnathus typhle TaxID=161592 RepID=UPI002A6AFDEC|nr:neural cell adhesion molecule 2-like [Syngnathus typhle]
MMLQLVHLVALLVCGSQAILQVSISLSKGELSVGDSKFFICSAIGEPVRLEWYNPQGERIVASKRMAFHTEASRSRLIIYNAIVEDAGIYRCRATEASGRMAEASVVLEIYQRLTFRDIQSPQEFRYGDTAEVLCDVISSPVPQVVWSYQGREITEERHSKWKSIKLVNKERNIYERGNLFSTGKVVRSCLRWPCDPWLSVSPATVVLSGLEPNTTYEVRVAAVNEMGQGEFSHMETFQTLPVREPSPPAVHGQRGLGKAYKLGLVKQDDGGMPIVEYIVKYKTDKEEQWMTKLVPGSNDFATLQPLQWNTRYEVEITARNVKGLSEPTFYQFFMPQKPEITESLFNGLSLGAVVGLGLGALLLLLVLVDVSCFFLCHCGLLMCITRKLRSKKTATGGKEMEEGKAAYLKLPMKEEIGKESLKPDTIEIKLQGDRRIHPKPDDNKA